MIYYIDSQKPRASRYKATAHAENNILYLLSRFPELSTKTHDWNIQKAVHWIQTKPISWKHK